MPAIDPKAAFIEFFPEDAKAARAQFPQKWFSHSATAALAQFAVSAATTEEMAGARKFLSILVNIGETPQEIQRLPVQKLDTLDK